MSAKTRNLEKRLAEVARELADRSRRAALAQCVCRSGTYADSRNVEDFEAELNLPCPAHEFRSLGSLFTISAEPETPEQEADNAKFERLVEQYYEERPLGRFRAI